jgi:hypothetical protein
MSMPRDAIPVAAHAANASANAARAPERGVKLDGIRSYRIFLVVNVACK